MTYDLRVAHNLWCEVVDDAPGAFIELLKNAIVGIRVDVTKLEGRFKMSQELPLGIVAGL